MTQRAGESVKESNGSSACALFAVRARAANSRNCLTEEVPKMVGSAWRGSAVSNAAKPKVSAALR